MPKLKTKLITLEVTTPLNNPVLVEHIASCVEGKVPLNSYSAVELAQKPKVQTAQSPKASKKQGK